MELQVCYRIIIKVYKSQAQYIILITPLSVIAHIQEK